MHPSAAERPAGPALRIRLVLLLAQFYARFMVRRVVATGLMANPSARWGTILTGLALVAVMTVGASLFLRQMAGADGFLPLLMDLTSISIILWVIIAFAVVKLLFSRSAGVLRTSAQLPVTAKERAAALMVVEAGFVAAIVTAVTFSGTAPALVLFGLDAVGRVLTGVVLPAALTYLLLNSLFCAGERALTALGFGRLRVLILLVVVLGMSALYYTTVLRQTVAVANAYTTGERVIVAPAALSALADAAGYPLAILAGAAGCALLAALCLVLSPRTRVPSGRFVPVPLGSFENASAARIFAAATVRSVEGQLAILLGLAAGAALAVSGAPPLLGMGAVVLQGVYAYEGTRRAAPLVLRTRSPLRHAAVLLGSQVLVLAVAALPLLVLSIVIGQSLQTTALAAAGLVSGTVVTVLVGVMVPPEKENPFSVLVGFSVVLVVGVGSVLMLGIVQAPPALTASLIVIALPILFFTTAAGIRIITERTRHEEGTPHHQPAVRRGNPHRDHHDRGAPVRHVLHHG
ncbi:hypothetical protein M3A96_06695 [Helcobacillus massiliensis]|uniref:hypothetical protein n=1 Tax=Helcobacillus TaxID=1161125 RepID=UPI001EF5D8AE|nr:MULTISPECIES: hypothetical protein [Helcobacillus]MCG7427096.1 hypothetical protein [Helcobacillus sp. ACRRO]MCT1557801.1 hypothetical protein [Helcobacillus massiliensis]MCT2036703.1 hypothetical protein [Helcobacillus massiliensis]MCT2332174.1 hypothetical protein [Helcobacillus massiliensis]MDK7742534.1 hypothetical protein [Helcobacillus massiliensis]